MTKAFELFKESLEKISDEDFAKFLDEMKNKELKIEVPQGYEIDKEKSTFEKIVFKKVEKELPKSWEELDIVKGFYVDSLSEIASTGEDICAEEYNRNTFPTKEEAKACLALAQLCQLRDIYNAGWKPDWEDGTEKCTVIYSNNELKGSFSIYTQRILSFKTQELRDKFLENFIDLINTAKPLL